MLMSCARADAAAACAVPPHLEMLGNRSRVQQFKNARSDVISFAPLSCYPGCDRRYCVRRPIFSAKRSVVRGGFFHRESNTTLSSEKLRRVFPAANRCG